ncbi:helix-turn-helix transcriptional regulator [Roseibium denhamense]|uniref:Regulatory protein, luxR family n=1 Tax=Roseibium denhamense TaxID=76305 RepID=A0ABY1N727_9HYPH|nr:LuxR C-terminal-related transcriptional regulator [Roseibium denhamense]SMP01852.1 regulatory protein, luxR family [Roseibium denhamense]
MPGSITWRSARPWLLFGLLGFCVFFIVTEEAVSAIWGEDPDSLLESDVLEYMVITALVLGFVASGFEVRQTLNRQRRLEQQIKAASGAFITLLEEHFEAWALTPSEADVAMLALKGFSISEIASIRKTAEGTVKAQCNAIYRKAGVSGRPQLLSLFIDELLNGAMEDKQAA